MHVNYDLNIKYLNTNLNVMHINTKYQLKYDARI